MMFNFNEPYIRKPPTIYQILSSICNPITNNEEDYIKTPDLAKNGRSKIFDFEYPLSEKITKEFFECLILNHYMMRRIGYDTVTAFKIGLNAKLNEIMPQFNQLINIIYDQTFFGDVTIREGNNNKNINNKSSNKLENNSNTNSETDNRYSDTPENRINDIKDGNYVTNYTFNKSNGNDSSKSSGESESTTDDNTEYSETTSHIDMFELYREFNNKLFSIYSMIFKELDILFYGIE